MFCAAPLLQQRPPGNGGRAGSYRVILTSRPETPIRYRIQSFPFAHLARCVLHRIDTLVVYRAISIYLIDKLRCISTTFLRVDQWPGAEAVDRLVQLAGHLFIWGDTADRFIYGGRAFADERVQEVLGGSYDDSAPEKRLDGIYLTVLDKSVSGYTREPENRSLLDALYTVVATIAVLAMPLDVRSLSHLTALNLGGVNKALLGLHSILDIPERDHLLNLASPRLISRLPPRYKSVQGRAVRCGREASARNPGSAVPQSHGRASLVRHLPAPSPGSTLVRS